MKKFFTSLTKMEFFLNKNFSIYTLKVFVLFSLTLYIFYILTLVVFFSSSVDSENDYFSSSSRGIPIAGYLLAPSSSSKSLFFIPRRKFTHTPTAKISVNSNQHYPKCSVTIAIILCEDDRYLAVKNWIVSNNSTDTEGMFKHNNTNSRLVFTTPRNRAPIAKDFSRQINQTLVLLKSIAILTKFDNVSSSRPTTAEYCVEVLLLSDKSQHYEMITTEINKKWSAEFQRTLKITNVPVRYPSGSAWMRKLFRPCATLRLFLAELLPLHDSVIYLDTDVIFFQNVQTLWSKFSKFGDDKEVSNENGNVTIGRVAAMAPCLFHYGSPANSVPFYGESGLNAGIMLMNLTRMRGTQWTNKIRMVTTMFQDKIKLADQDILNIYFHFFPEELHLLSCDWNFRPFQCREGSYCEDKEILGGISALHGNALSFTAQGPEPLFHSVYQTFHKVKLDDGFNLTRLVDQLERALLKAEEAPKRHSSDCKKFGGLNVLLLNRLYDIIERQ